MPAPFTPGGPMVHVGFAVLAVLMLLTTARAFVAIRRRQIPVHQAWMTRFHALVFTAVTFRARPGPAVTACLTPGVAPLAPGPRGSSTCTSPNA